MTQSRGRGLRLRQTAGWLILVATLFLGWAAVSNDFYLRLMMVAGVFIIAVVPFDLLMGHMGYLSMGQVAFFGIGAYIIGNLTALQFEYSFWPALVVALVALALIAYVLSFPLFRLRGDHFAIGTLAVGQLAWLVFDSWDWFTGGVFGTNGIPRPAIGGFEFNTNSRFYLLVAFFVFVAAWSSWLLAQGRVGRALRRIRQDEELAAARGLDVLRYKRIVFVFAAVFAGLAGALFAPMQISIDPSSFTIWTSFQFVIFTILGGSGTLIGPALGVIFLTILDQLVQEFGKWNQLVLGFLIVLVVLFFRGGLWGGLRISGQLCARLVLGARVPANRAAEEPKAGNAVP